MRSGEDSLENRSDKVFENAKQSTWYSNSIPQCIYKKNWNIWSQKPVHGVHDDLYIGAKIIHISKNPSYDEFVNKISNLF